MAAAHETLSTTHLEAATSQGVNRQGSRKRKQNMPSSAASSDDVNHKPTDSMSQVQIDKKLSATIKAVASFDFPEAFVLSCVLDMKNSGRAVTSSTLLEECEQRFLDETTPQTITGEVDHAGCQYFSGSEQLGATSESSRSALPYVPSQSTNHNFTKSSHSANSSSSSGAQNYYSSTNIPTKENELSRQIGTNGYNDNTTYHSAQYSSIASADSCDYGDSIDGCPPVEGLSESGFNAGAQSGSDSLNKSYAASVLPYSLQAVTGNMVSNLDKQVSESFSTQQPGPSNCDQKNISNHTRNGSVVFNDLTDTATVRVNNVVNGAEAEREKTNSGRETIPAVKASSETNAEYRKLCFELVEKEHALLEKSRLCSLCLSRPRDVTFLPCGHFTSCRSCAEPTYVCPCCNRSILATVDTYLS